MNTKDRDEKDTDTTVSASKLAWLEARLVELKALEKEVNVEFAAVYAPESSALLGLGLLGLGFARRRAHG
ncbi:MAG: hypothetical protein ACI9T9_001935 [Oleiphilaceae bacterium]|jgi:hypothetical protein